MKISFKSEKGTRVKIQDPFRQKLMGATGTIIDEERWGMERLFVISLDQAGHTQSWVRTAGVQIKVPFRYLNKV